MMPALVKLMWLEAIAYWGDMLIAFLLGAVAWHWIARGWRAFTRWVWQELEHNGYKR